MARLSGRLYLSLIWCENLSFSCSQVPSGDKIDKIWRWCQDDILNRVPNGFKETRASSNVRCYHHTRYNVEAHVENGVFFLADSLPVIDRAAFSWFKLIYNHLHTCWCLIPFNSSGSIQLDLHLYRLSCCEREWCVNASAFDKMTTANEILAFATSTPRYFNRNRNI